MKRISILFAVAFLVASCSPRNYAVLLEDPAGHNSAVSVEGPNVSATLETPGTAVGMDPINNPRPQPWTPNAEVLSATLCSATLVHPERPERLVFYFDLNSDELTDANDPTLVALMKSIARHPGTDADVMGHTDRSDSEKYNQGLSERRAETVRALLVRAGVPAERIAVGAYGETLPAVPTADGVREAKNRRVEVTIR